mgnify:CR=1 FL=1
MFNKLIKHSDSLYVSAIMISILEFSNLFTIYLIINKNLLHLNSNLFIGLIIVVVIGIFQISANTIYYKKNCNRLCEKYKGETLIIKIIGYVFYVVYFIGSVVLVLFLAKNGYTS